MAILDFLSAIDVSKIDLIELGSGNSTHVFSTMFHQVISYENNASWAETLEHHLPANVTLHRFTGETLDPQSVPVEPEHWLLVDFSGKRTRFISEFLTGKSTDMLPVVVILDNSDWYRNGARLLATAGYREIPFYGMKSGQTWISCTSFSFCQRESNWLLVNHFISRNFPDLFHLSGIAWNKIDRSVLI